MKETNTKPVDMGPIASTSDAAEKAAAVKVAAFETFRQQQQRRPLNLMQCMDKDGNIDAFRYIEYSRRRRLEFLKRADFICKMKSTLRMQHQHQQLLNRSASMPGMTAAPVIPSVPSTMANAVFKTPKHSGSVSPDTTSTGGTMLSDDLKSLGAVGNSNKNKNNDGENKKLTSLLHMPTPVRLMARSASMPFVVSSFGTNSRINNNGTNTGVTAPYAGSRNAEFNLTPRPQLRKEEFEAAEALLFGMGRDPSKQSHRPDASAGNKRRDAPSSDNTGKDTEAVSGDEGKDCTNSVKKQKVTDTPQGETLSRSEEIESVLSVVSSEDDSSGNNYNNAVHGFCSTRNTK